MKTCKTIQTGSRMRRPALSILSLSLAVALAGVAGQAEAFEFGSQDGFNATIITTIGYGIGWATVVLHILLGAGFGYFAFTKR